MKKKISIVLAFVMVMSIFSSFTFAVETSTSAASYAVFKNSPIGQRVLALSKNEILEFALALYSVAEKKDTFIGDLEEILERDLNTAYVNIVVEKLKSKQSRIVDVLLTTENFEPLMEEVYTYVYEALLADETVASYNNKVNAELKTGKTQEALVLAVVDVFVKNIELKGTAGNYQVEIQEEAIKSELMAIISEYFVDPSKVYGFYGSLKQISTGERAILSALKAKFEERLNDGTFTSGQISAMMKIQTLLKGPATTTPPGGGGGIFLPPAATDKAIVAIEDYIKAMKKDAGLAPVVVLNFDDIKTANKEVALPSAAIQMLVENKLSLVINTKVLSYEIPFAVLEGMVKDLPANSTLEFKSALLTNEVARGLIKDNKVSKIGTAIEFKVNVKDAAGKVLKGITKFNGNISVAIEVQATYGNADKLGVYFINEATGAVVFKGGKIRNNRITMRTNHFSKFAILEYTQTFTDLTNHWAKDYVESMAAKHVISGFADGSYRPQNLVTRAQFVKLLVEALELEVVEYKGEFTDVANTYWGRDYIATAKANGIVLGYGDRTFKPEQPITRAEIASILAKALELNYGKATASNLTQFRDVKSIPVWSANFFSVLLEEGIFVGSNGILNPTGQMTRAEAATVIYRIYNR